MRLHSLALEAFGPYAQRQVIDFDELNQAGVFLLTGPTGAGKTSVLDAVCFALYGVVPGDREVRELRSAHASPDVPTRVSLEVTLRERRLRIERWPEWQRPKKRGVGTTPERAGARLVEILSDGSERLISARAQEVGLELGSLLGMSSEQFKQVVLLPQGGFSTFLKADSDQRRAVLEKLFATQRFGRIELWLADRAGELRRSAEQERSELLQLLSAMAHRSGHPRPEELDETALRQWRTEVLDAAEQSVELAAAAERRSRDAFEASRERARRVARHHAAQVRRDEAVARLAAMDSSRAESELEQTRLRAHRSAAAVGPLLVQLVQAETARTTAHERATRRRAELGEALDRAGCETAAADLQRRIGELRGAEPLVHRLSEARDRLQRLRTEAATAATRLQRAVDAADTLPQHRETLTDRLADLRTTAAHRPELVRRLTAAVERRQAAESLPHVRSEAETLEAQVQHAYSDVNRARAAHLDLFERRLLGMAAELAGELRPDTPCQVCGSPEHPRPAGPAPDAVTQEQQEQAHQRAEEARRHHESLQERYAAAREQLSVLQQSAGGLDLEAARRDETSVRDDLELAEAAHEESLALELELAQVEARIQEASDALERARRDHQEVTRQLAGTEEVVAATEPQVRDVLGGSASLPEALATARRRLDLVQAAGEALGACEHAEQLHEQCHARAEQEALESGFTDLAQARTAVLPDDEVALLELGLEQRAADRTHAERVLGEPDVRALAVADVPHDATALAEAEADVEAAEVLLEEAAVALHTSRRDRTALVGLDDQVAAAIAAWLPVREEHTLADAMSRLVRGVGGDNHLQMRLSSYVLATRLDQVLDAANERLQQMRDSRYTLHRSGRTRAGRRSGLDIEVLDDWTGELRAPTSLSGGETFKLSLALALGLADVITHESGGLDIETLFIDEGFGMLDPDTLDEVMDCIDDLRTGGRSVGVVSHVTELRSRVSTQLHVSPSREGSRIRLTTGVL
jgi:DNA repair protein SbcC/Rad50